jgi:hypothetical protein
VLLDLDTDTRERPVGSAASPAAPSARRGSNVAVALVAALLLTLGSVKQPHWPATWIDEGFVLDAAKSLAVDGRYALRSSDGWRVLDQPLVANGPGVVLPAAFALRMLGVGLWQARVIAVAFMVLCGVLLFVAARRLGGPLAGAVALVLTLALPRDGFLYLGRMVMGNVPALAYFFAGALLLMAARERHHRWLGLAAGLCFGAAAVTKAQWAVVLVPALLLVWVVDEFLLDKRDDGDIPAAIGGLLAVLAAWFGLRLAMQGQEGFAQDLTGVQASARWTVFALEPYRYLPSSLRYLLRSGILVVWVIGQAYATWLVTTRRPGAIHAVLFAAVSTVWLAWYAVVSVGWERYAFEPSAVSAVLAGAAIAQAGEIWRAWPVGRAARSWRMAAVALAVTLGAYVVAQGSRRAGELAAVEDTSVQDFARFVNQHVDPGVLIESWEWQLGILTDHSVHHPTNDWVDRYTAAIFGGVPVSMRYRWLDLSPAYLVDGPFSKFTTIYAADLAAGCCTLVATHGGYDLYRVYPVGGSPAMATQP